ncbi:MAG TPA: ATP-grasp domain-containing protein [Dehalococcoidales bacterium]|nr:ATP-grasp domain-containing protein [Dehalococcoidales bacterium]
MTESITIIYNQPASGAYHQLGEGLAIEGVMESVKAVKSVLTRQGYSVQTLALKPPLSLAESELKRIESDIVFNLFEGFDGWPESEAAIALFLEESGVCFTGSPSRALRICENKAEMKKILRSHGIATPDWQVIYPGCAEKLKLAFPCIVKPLGEHASHGLSCDSVVWDVSGLMHQVELIWQNYRNHSLVELFLPGREFRSTVVGNGHLSLLPIEEILYNLPAEKPRLLTYSAKWIKGDEYFVGTSEQCPTNLDHELENKINAIAAAAFLLVGCRSYASIDLRLDNNGEPMVIDINPNPDISSEGGIKYPVKASGMDYTSFIELVLSSARKETSTTLQTIKP